MEAVEAPGKGQQSHQAGYRWRHLRVWSSVILYWFVTTAGAGILDRSGLDGLGWTVFSMLVFVGLCMKTERGRWKLWQRIAFLPFAWGVQALFGLFFAHLFGPGLIEADRAHLVDRMGMLLGSFPLVLFAMRQSRLYTITIRAVDPRCEGQGPK